MVKFSPSTTLLTEVRAMLALTYSGVGRGGEVKFVDTQNWMFDPKFNFLDTQWTELKTLERYAMPCVNNKDDYTYDIFHCLGSYFMLEGGLIRTAEQDPIKTFLFVDLHSLKNATVTKKISDIIRSNLPNNTPDSLKKEYSAKSIRRGAVSELMFHPDLDGLNDICGRTGHSTQTNLESYADRQHPLRAIRGGMVLAGWDNCRAVVNPPSFSCLAAGEQIIDNFVEAILPTTLLQFKKGGHLHAVLRICAATLVMYHKTVTSDLGPANIISTKLREMARRVNVVDPSFPVGGETADLFVWVKTLKVSKSIF